jgi:DNA-binding MarR family transcriptional regulator
MAQVRLSQLQHRILAWLQTREQRVKGAITAGYQELTQALTHDKGNLSRSLANLEAKGLVRVVRTSSGKAEAVDVTPAGRRAVVNKP